MIFKKSPDNLFNAVFNVPQGAVMTVAVSLYMGQADAVSLLRTFVCAYCAGVMLTALCAFRNSGTAWPPCCDAGGRLRVILCRPEREEC